MSNIINEMIETAIKPIENKHLCYLNNVLIGSFNTWHGANDYLVIKVNELIQNKNKNQQDNIKRNKVKQRDVYYPRNQDDEATKAILEYHRSLKD